MTHQKTRFSTRQVKPVIQKPVVVQQPKLMDVVPDDKSADPIGKIKNHKNAENQDQIVCDICLEDDDFEGDEIVICELCFSACHQSCYGG